MKIAIIGCGDVGRCYAQALAQAGTPVAAFCDARSTEAVEQLVADAQATFYTEPGPWLADVDVVISAVFGGVSHDVLRQSLPHMRQGALYADFTTAPVADLQASEHAAIQTGVDFVDVAIIGTISLSGAQTPLLCSGHGADRVVALMQSVGAPARVVSNSAGDAISLKLLRSVFTKGVEALTIECLMAAERRGLRHELYDVLADFDQSPIRNFMETLVVTHVRHAPRRLNEVREAGEQLRRERVEPLVTEQVAIRFERTADALDRAPFTGEATMEDSLAWLLDHQ